MHVFTRCIFFSLSSLVTEMRCFLSLSTFVDSIPGSRQVCDSSDLFQSVLPESANSNLRITHLFQRRLISPSNWRSGGRCFNVPSSHAKKRQNGNKKMACHDGHSIFPFFSSVFGMWKLNISPHFPVFSVWRGERVRGEGSVKILCRKFGLEIRYSLRKISPESWKFWPK